MLSSILILDAQKVTSGPVAIIELPFRLRNGIHGSWVQGSDFVEEKDLCDMAGVTKELRDEFKGPITLPALTN
jgi:hypothetical protein